MRKAGPHPFRSSPDNEDAAFDCPVSVWLIYDFLGSGNVKSILVIMHVSVNVAEIVARKKHVTAAGTRPPDRLRVCLGYVDAIGIISRKAKYNFNILLIINL